ncbi:MAG: hypothetical protein ACRDLV_13025 [Solirubrobacteraceae bacterium]
MSASDGRADIAGAGVLVVYEADARGRAALLAADRLARERAAPLRVLVVVPFERENVGCGRCRQSAVMWNRELREIAADELEEAAKLLGPGREAVYESVRGLFAESIVRVAAREGVRDVVLPHRRRGALRGLRPDWLDRIGCAGAWRVTVGPPAYPSAALVTR